MILSISNIAWNPSDKIQVYNLLHKNNFTGLEVAPGLLFSHLDDPIHPSNQDLQKVIKELDFYNLQLVSMQSLLYGKKDALLFGNKKEREFFFNELLNVIQLAEKLEIPNLVFGSPINRIIPNDMCNIDAEDIALITFSKLGDVAAKMGTCISIEPNPVEYGTNFINNTNEAIAFVKKLNCPGVRVNLDIGSVKMNDDFNNLPNILEKAIKYINHVHISEPYLMPAPESSIEFEYLYNLLYESGYKKAISIEMLSKNYPIHHIEKFLIKMSKISN